jgi:hypothetical protein
MADATDTNEIIIDPARCIYVKDDNNSEIYFSNYYLNKVINKNPPQNLFKIQFSDKNFMNIDAEEPQEIKTVKTEIAKLQTLKIDTLDSLDNSTYSKLTYTPGQEPGINLDTNITADSIIKVKSKSEDTKTIFANIEQVMRYLKYNGYWYPGQPERLEFSNRDQTPEITPLVKKVKEAVGGEEQGPVNAGEDNKDNQAGGKKTTTRRRRKAGYNKHRKSNRRR